MQKLIGKNVALDAAGEAMRGAAGRGLYTNGFFMLGFPGETREDMLETIKFACGSPLTQALFLGSCLVRGRKYGWNAARRDRAKETIAGWISSASGGTCQAYRKGSSGR
jgi:hypothetical protein